MKNRPRRTRLILGAIISPLVMGGLLAGTGQAAPAMAATCTAAPGGQPPSPGTSNNELHGVTDLSPCDAWAAGFQISAKVGMDQTLIEHWDGRAWTVVPSPNPGDSGALLNSVHGTSANDVWAVGEFGQGTVGNSLILHWNGTAWTQVTSPSPNGDDELNGVWALSARDAWAVGDTVTSTGTQPLILHWNGTNWMQVPSPPISGPGADARLFGVTATSHGDAWAVGTNLDDSGTSGDRSFIMHWNGLRWVTVPSPHRGPRDDLLSVTATSPFNAWAVGTSGPNDRSQTFILRWNGRQWAQQPSPDPAGQNNQNLLHGVTATSPFNAWAVGRFTSGSSSTSSLVLHWNGLRWAQVKSTSPGSITDLLAVGTSSPADAWAVGTFTPGKALALRLGLGSLLGRTGRAAMAP